MSAMNRLLNRINTRWNLGRRTCGYCGWGWRHQPHCPLTGRIEVER